MEADWMWYPFSLLKIEGVITISDSNYYSSQTPSSHSMQYELRVRNMNAWRIWKSQAGGGFSTPNCKDMNLLFQTQQLLQNVPLNAIWWGFRWYFFKGIYLQRYAKLGCDYPYGSVTVCAATIIPASNTANIITSDQIPPHLTVVLWQLPQCTFVESLKEETQRFCDKMWQHYSTMRILTPKRTLEDRSDRSATLLCTARE